MKYHKIQIVDDSVLEFVLNQNKKEINTQHIMIGNEGLSKYVNKMMEHLPKTDSDYKNFAKHHTMDYIEWWLKERNIEIVEIVSVTLNDSPSCVCVTCKILEMK